MNTAPRSRLFILLINSGAIDAVVAWGDSWLMQDRCIAQEAVLSLFSVKFKSLQLASGLSGTGNQSLSIPRSKGPETVMSTGRIEAKLSVAPLRKARNENAGHPRSTQASPLSSRRSVPVGNRFRRSPRSSSFPRRSQGCALPMSVRLAAQGSSPGGPRLLALVSQQNCPSRGPVGVKILGNRQQMAHRMFPARQSHCPFVAGGMFAERYILCRAVGKVKLKAAFS